MSAPSKASLRRRWDTVDACSSNLDLQLDGGREEPAERFLARLPGVLHGLSE